MTTNGRAVFKTLLLSSCLLMPGIAWSQETPAESADEIVISGQRPIAESEAAALTVQRKSDSLVSVAASDSVGRLPDQNIAQATGRLPGVAVQRDQGQARYISLRGAPINWTTLSINDIAIVSPEGRDTRYDSIPSAIAAQILVRKAVTPDMTGETVAGNVDVVTRSAFDYSGLHIAGKLGGGYVELGGGKEYEGQLVVSDRWDTGIGRIGVVISGSYYERNMVTDNFENDWEAVSRDVQPGGFGASPKRLWARETENKLYRMKRRNYSYSGRLDWEPSAGHRIFAESIFTTFLDEEVRDNYVFDLDDRENDLNRPAGCTITPTNNPPTTGYADVCMGNTPLKGTVYGIDILQRTTLRELEQSIFTNTLGGNHEFGDSWELIWRLNYTKAKDDRGNVGEARYESPATRNLRPTIEYDFTDPMRATYKLYRTVGTNAGPFSAGAQVTNIDDFQRNMAATNALISNDFVDITKAYTGKFGLSHKLSLLGGDGTITFGAQYDQRTKEANEAQLSLTNTQASAAGISTTFPPDSSDERFRGAIPMSYAFRYFDVAKMRSNVDKARAVATYNPLPANYYNVREQVYAAYLTGRVAYDWGSILGGARLEHVKNQGRAFVNGNVALPVEVKNDMTLVYPSLHANFNLANDKKLRLSFNTGAARPDYDQLRPNFTYSDAAQTITGGNPLAKPERAYGVDGYFEWYIEPQGYAMVGVFYKKVQDVLFNATRTFGLDILDSGGVDRSDYKFTTIVNGGSGHLYGLEAALQLQLEPYSARLGLPDWMGGFGLSANITFNKSSSTTPTGEKLSLPGTSPVVYNVGAYYEKYGFSARLNYQKRTAWLDVLGDVLDGGPQYWASEDELDFSARMALTKNFEVYFDASNLLDGPGRRYVRESIYTLEWEKQGRRFTGGFRVTF